MDLAALLDRRFRARPGPTTNKGDETGRFFHLSGSQTVASRCSNRPTLPRVNVWPNNSEGRKCQKICPECLSDGRVVNEDQDNGAKCVVLAPWSGSCSQLKVNSLDNAR